MELGGLLRALVEVRAGGSRIAAWSVYASEFRRASLGTKDGETGNPHAPLALAEGLNVRYRVVWDDGRVSRGLIERRPLARDPASALRTARAAAYDDPDGREVSGPADFPEVTLHDPAVAAAAEGDVALFAPVLAAIRERVGDAGVRTWSGSLQAALGTGRVVTSAGLDETVTGTSIVWHATFDGELGAGRSGRTTETAEETDARLRRLAGFVRALRRASRPRAGGEVPVLLHPDVVEEYVLAVLFHNLDGTAVAHGTGAFARERFGASAAELREDLTLRHDPLVPMAAGAYRFTQEGVPAAPVAYIERGRLVAPLVDLKYAKRLGIAPNASPAAMDTVFFEGPEPLAYDEALERADGGALVLAVLGVHTQDFTSGDFSLSAPQTLAVGPSGVEGRLRATISGNVFALLRSEELALVRFPGEHTPGILVRCRLDPV